MENKYVYPCLAPANKDYGFFRVSGPGLANCMVLAAKAYCIAQQSNAQFVEPTWFKFSLGPYLRGEKDKRHYFRVFKTVGISGLKKASILLRKSEYNDDSLSEFAVAASGICRISKMRKLFQDMDPYYTKEYFDSIITDQTKQAVEGACFEKTVAVHVRLGDFNAQQRTPIQWFVDMIQKISSINPELKYLVFSDGTDNEISQLLAMKNVRRADFGGQAINDIYAISKCSIVIASNSTFSAMGAFWGQKPVIFNDREFGSIFPDSPENELVIKDNSLPEEWCKKIKTCQ